MDLLIEYAKQQEELCMLLVDFLKGLSILQFSV